MKKYYIEMCWYPSNGENYVMQSRWFDTEEQAVQWAHQINWLSDNLDAYLMSAEWNVAEDCYGDIIQERLLAI